MNQTTEAATKQVLKPTLAFPDYTCLEEKEGTFFHRQLRTPGTSTMTITLDNVLFTFDNAIYTGSLEKVDLSIESISDNVETKKKRNHA